MSLARLDAALAGILAEIAPLAVVALGLAAGEPVIRLERIAVNLAAFDAPDNDGARIVERPLAPGGPPALRARLDLPAIQRALLDRGIPARLSNSAGTYLCNAAMYRWLALTPRRVPCGFVHLPHLRAEAAAKLSVGVGESGLMGLASMEFPTMRRAVEIVLETIFAKGPRKASARA
ncbi:MAG: pyroglutamyl-peptidase I [Rhodospirillales bacterium]|nr:pyroglutamyl-peptidase I [Rhodospirillales bacterium]